MAAAQQDSIPTGLLQIPLELKQHIIRHVSINFCFILPSLTWNQISPRREILNFALTCHTLELATRPFRYRTLVIQDFPIPDAKPDILYWLKCLTVRERKHEQTPHPGYTASPSKNAALDDKLGNDLSLIPRDQLKSFKWVGSTL